MLTKTYAAQMSQDDRYPVLLLSWNDARWTGTRMHLLLKTFFVHRKPSGEHVRLQLVSRTAIDGIGLS